VVVKLRPLHSLKVKVKTFECHEHVPRQLLDAGAFESIYFLVALLTLVLIVAVKHVSLDERLHTFMHVLLILYSDADCQHGFRATRLVRAVLADHLVS
jgi:hypothetical protein